MCGIVGYTGPQQAAPVLLEGLKKLEYRGYDSAGVAVNERGGIHMVKSAGMIRNLCEKTHDGSVFSGTSGIGHTRWATHGAPTDENAHPHVSNDGRFAVIHNGIIENYLALREELSGKGFTFKSETDTEVIVNLLELYYEGDFKQAMLKTIARLEGSYAIGAVCADRPGEVFAARQFSPLILGLGVGENFLASDVTALVAYTKNVIYLDDGELAELSPAGVTVYDCTGRPIDKPVSRVTWDVEAAAKGGFEHFMLKEIIEQPRALKATIDPRIKDGRVVLDDFRLSDEELKNLHKIYITACGSAYYAGQAGKYVIEALARVPVETDIASELRYRDPIIDEHTLMIVISQSGETADTIAALREAKARGAKTLAICNVVGSTIARLADTVIYTWAGPEIAVATTKGYTTQVAVLNLLAVYLARRLGRIDDDEERRLVGELNKLPQQMQRAIDLNPGLEDIANSYFQNREMFFIGRNLDYAVCLESSLKLKEISYIHSDAFAAGELKHGPIALIEPGRLVVAVACHERLFDKTMSNIKEVKARGAEVLGVAMEGNSRILVEADKAIYVPRCEPLFTAVPAIVPMQLFAYYVAKANGCDIDKPKNLAKSVTVE
ncbi:MAG: glutamine--fructose-6-phosphate transaminase (isomerizing) [Oscillospiraceae bacterium]|jgi:glucosamine--fructose-6-phosphate aminotransferase (isomerizing)|nr:glutamine--fructose-6-phosphate transaminase (isomerizing) [Oscillospiraceae bacterium]